MSTEYINNLRNELAEKGWNLLKFEQVTEPAHVSGMWVYRVQRANLPDTKIYGEGVWCEDAEIAADNIRSDIHHDEEKKIWNEGKKPFFDVAKFVKQARGKGYTFHLYSDGHLGLGFADVEEIYDTVQVECRIYKEEIKEYLSLEAAKAA